MHVNDMMLESRSTSSSGSTTLEAIREQIEMEDSGKWDALVHRDDLVMQHGKILVPGTVAVDYANELSPTPWALSQMCGRLRMPTAYFRRCPKDLQDEQFNYWARNAQVGSEEENEHLRRSDGSQTQQYNTPSRWLLRAKDDQLRGVLSDRYCKLDHAPLIETLQPLLPQRLQAKWFALTDESLHLRLIDPTLAREVLKDDRLMVGLHISNSEVGKKSITVDAIVWRQVCSNGLVRLVNGKSLMQQKHIGLSSYRMKNALEKAVGEALTTAAGLLEKMAQATQEYLDEPEEVIEHLREVWNLSEAFEQRIKDNLLQEPTTQQHTSFGLINAITQSAQSLSPDERYDMEVKAGSLLDNGIRLLPNAKAKRRRSLAVPIGATLSHTSSHEKNGNGTSGYSHRNTANDAASGGPTATATATDVMSQAKRMFGGEAVSRTASTSIAQVPTALESPPKEQYENGSASSARQATIAEASLPQPLSSLTQHHLIWTLARKRGLVGYDVSYLIEENFSKSEVEELTRTEAQELMNILQQRPLEHLLAPVPSDEEMEAGELNSDEIEDD